MIIVEDVAYTRIIDSVYIMNLTFSKRETLFTSSQSLQSLNMVTESWAGKDASLTLLMCHSIAC